MQDRPRVSQTVVVVVTVHSRLTTKSPRQCLPGLTRYPPSCAKISAITRPGGSGVISRHEHSPAPRLRTTPRMAVDNVDEPRPTISLYLTSVKWSRRIRLYRTRATDQCGVHSGRRSYPEDPRVRPAHSHRYLHLSTVAAQLSRDDHHLQGTLRDACQWPLCEN